MFDWKLIPVYLSKYSFFVVFCLSWFSRTSQNSLLQLKMSNVLWWFCPYWDTWIWDSGFVNRVNFWPLWPPRNHQQVCGVVVLRCSLCVVSNFNVKWMNLWKAAGMTLAFITSWPDRWPSGNINPDDDCASSDLAPQEYGFSEVFDGQV